MSDQERIMSLEAEIRRLVVELGKANISWAKLAQAMEHTQQRAESAHARIDELSKDSSSQFKEQSKAILNLTVAQERLSGLIQKNVMTKEKFFGWLVIGATALAVLYSAIGKVLN